MKLPERTQSILMLLNALQFNLICMCVYKLMEATLSGRCSLLFFVGQFSLLARASLPKIELLYSKYEIKLGCGCSRISRIRVCTHTYVRINKCTHFARRCCCAQAREFVSVSVLSLCMWVRLYISDCAWVRRFMASARAFVGLLLFALFCAIELKSLDPNKMY